MHTVIERLEHTVATSSFIPNYLFPPLFITHFIHMQNLPPQKYLSAAGKCSDSFKEEKQKALKNILNEIEKELLFIKENLFNRKSEMVKQ